MATRYGRVVFVAAVVLLVSGAVPVWAAPSPETASSAAAATSGSSAVLYAELPIAGVIGKDVTADQVSAALKMAAGSKAIKHIVVKIKSPGGQAAGAKEISDLIKSYDGRLEFHASVEQAAGAGVLIALSCQTIHMADGATLGGAAVGEEKPAVSAVAASAASATAVKAVQPEIVWDTPKTAVSAKSAVKAKAAVAEKVDALPVNLGDEAAAIAEAHGRSGALARALVGEGGEVYAWKDKEGKVQIGDHAPDGIAADQMIVSNAAKTVLTLKSSQAVALGLAKAQHGGSATLGDDLGMAGWKAAGGNLALAMKEAKQRAAEKESARVALEKKKVENTEKRKKAKDFIEQNQKDAEKIDPRSGSYTFLNEGGNGNNAILRFDMKSFNLWKERSDKCLANWNNVLAGIKTMLTLEKEAEGFGLDRLMDKKSLSELFDKAQGEIKRLNAEHNNNKAPK